MLSYYALADRENMRKSFLRLLDVRAELDDFNKLIPEVGFNVICYPGNRLKNILVVDR